MGDYDDGVPIFGVDVLNQLQDLLGGAVVQCAGGFVAEQDIRILDDGPANGNTLLLSAGKLVGQLIPVLIEPQRVQQLVDIQRIVRSPRIDM